jgi:hypothetical protein
VKNANEGKNQKLIKKEKLLLLVSGAITTTALFLRVRVFIVPHVAPPQVVPHVAPPQVVPPLNSGILLFFDIMCRKTDPLPQPLGFKLVEVQTGHLLVFDILGLMV